MDVEREESGTGWREAEEDASLSLGGTTSVVISLSNEACLPCGVPVVCECSDATAIRPVCGW